MLAALSLLPLLEAATLLKTSALLETAAALLEATAAIETAAALLKPTAAVKAAAGKAAGELINLLGGGWVSTAAGIVCAVVLHVPGPDRHRRIAGIR